MFSSSSSGGIDDTTRTALPPFVFCRLVAPTSLTTDLRLVMEWDGVEDMMWLDKVGRTASIAGSVTDGLDVIGPCMSGRSVAQTIGEPGGLVSGAGLGG